MTKKVNKLFLNRTETTNVSIKNLCSILKEGLVSEPSVFCIDENIIRQYHVKLRDEKNLNIKQNIVEVNKK